MVAYINFLSVHLPRRTACTCHGPLALTFYGCEKLSSIYLWLLISIFFLCICPAGQLAHVMARWHCHFYGCKKLSSIAYINFFFSLHLPRRTACTCHGPLALTFYGCKKLPSRYLWLLIINFLSVHLPRRTACTCHDPLALTF